MLTQTFDDNFKYLPLLFFFCYNRKLKLLEEKHFFKRCHINDSSPLHFFVWGGPTYNNQKLFNVQLFYKYFKYIILATLRDED